MEELKFKTIDECNGFINCCKMMGQPIPDWVLTQKRFFENGGIVVSDTPIWSTLRLHYPYGTMPQEKIDCVESTVTKLMEEGSHAEEPGLLLGKIQCGKTDTFEDIIGLSFDRGIDIAIVLTKGTKALVNQTIKRMKHDFRFFKRSDDLSRQTVIDVHDIMKIWKNLKQAQVESGKTVIVCKKNATNLEHLMEMFRNNAYLRNKKVLVVDDEADFASRNYRTVKMEAQIDDEGLPIVQEKEMEMAKIAQQIDDFRTIPSFCRYLQVTATPYCLYLQPQGELNLNGQTVKPFKPRFTSLVPSHDRYIGGEEYFVKSRNDSSMYSHLYHQIEQKCIDVLGREHKSYLNNPLVSKNIFGLTSAIVSFFMATAIRRIQMRESSNMDYKTTAVIHVEIDKKNHDWQRRVVNRIISAVKTAVINNDKSDQRVWMAFTIAYQDFVDSNAKGKAEGLINVDVPPEEAVMTEIRDIFRTNDYNVQIVNSNEQMDTLLDEDTGELKLDNAATIFIGGNILDRGVTIQHMLCFFYGRNPKNFQQDTVLQHARMYGARSKEDMAVMRLHTTPQIYRILARMNELDEQLREWFIEGHDKDEPNAVFVGYDKNIKPCAMQKIKATNTILLKPQQRVLPIGFWTEDKATTTPVVKQIEHMIESSPNYDQQDSNGFFKMGKEDVMEILKLIESIYVYDRDKHFNYDRKNDIKEMMCALTYCAARSGGDVYVLHRTNRNMSRVRENGGWIDAPDDGRTDTAPAREKAINCPVLMLLQQNGERVKNESGENVGWNGAPFYWPVLMTQENIGKVMFGIDQSRKGEAIVDDLSEFYEGYDRDDILNLTYSGDLEMHFGTEGTVYDEGAEEIETRHIKATTAAKYLQRDDNGEWLLNPSVPFDTENDHSVYSANNGFFPFMLRPYKYLCLRNRRDALADVMLLELLPTDQWDVIEYPTFNTEGDLIDRDTKEVLVRSTDTHISKDLATTDFYDDTVTQWLILFKVRRIVKFKKRITEEADNG